MNNDEVKAALKWWRVNRKQVGFVRGQEITLADAFAAEHPPDEDEPITPEWLNGRKDLTRQIGRFYPHWLYGDTRTGAMTYEYKNGWAVQFKDGFWPKRLTTRGQLLRLLKELEQ